MLLVPSAASAQGAPQPLVPPTIDHFQCHRVKRGRNQPTFAPITVSVSDALESLTLTLLRPHRLCMPVDKNGEDASAPNIRGAIVLAPSGEPGVWDLASPTPFASTHGKGRGHPEPA
jgi:hypothetical protein